MLLCNNSPVGVLYNIAAVPVQYETLAVNVAVSNAFAVAFLYIKLLMLKCNKSLLLLYCIVRYVGVLYNTDE
jgi:hypothetical protein